METDNNNRQQPAIEAKISRRKLITSTDLLQQKKTNDINKTTPYQINNKEIMVSSSSKRKQQQLLIPSIYTLFLILITATITWTLSSILHASSSFLNDDPSSLVVNTNTNKKRTSFVVNTTNNKKRKETTNNKKSKVVVVFNYSDYTGPSRVYPKFEHPFPCFKGEKVLMLDTPAQEGILFHRPMKTGSTTLTGMVLRLVHNRGQQQYGYDKCKHRSIHGSGIEFDFYNRNHNKSILFSLIREPTSRALSQIFHFEISVGMHEPTDDYILRRMLQKANYAHYFMDLGTRRYFSLSKKSHLRELFMQENNYNLTQISYNDENHDVFSDILIQKRKIARLRKWYTSYNKENSYQDIIHDILTDYDLILIMERMDESLVALQMLFNFTTKEILYTRARSGGSFSNGLSDRPCVYILPTFKSTYVQEFLSSSPEWQEHIAPDIEFYKAAHKSLDRTIAALGRTEFEARLATFQKALKLAAINCEDRVRTMCSNGGKKIYPVNTTCYFWGEGCDHDCIDELDIDY